MGGRGFTRREKQAEEMLMSLGVELGGREE